MTDPVASDHSPEHGPIVVIDLGVGNIGSVVNMLRHVGARPRVADTPDALEDAQKIVMPGVGHWDHAARSLDVGGWRPALNELVRVDRRPLLGVCLGMQLLLEGSEEGDSPGLGWVAGRATKFDFGMNGSTRCLRIPHMGWNIVRDKTPSPLSPGDADERRFYFAHSFHASHVDDADVLMVTHHGYEFTVAVHHDNVWGVQFHPEKSHRFGTELLRRFVGM